MTIKMPSSYLCVVLKINLLVKLRLIQGVIRDLTQPRRQRQRKRHLIIQVRVTCTTLRLFQYVQLLQCDRTIQ